MSVPNFEFPNSPHIAGDAKDDDAAVINALVESHAEPPTPEELPLKSGVDPLITPPKITRLITNTINVSKDWVEPTQVLPADPNRIGLEVNVNSVTAADTVYFADEKNKAQNASTALVISPATRSFSLSGHTGALWIYAPLVADVALVTVAAVTK